MNIRLAISSCRSDTEYKKVRMIQLDILLVFLKKYLRDSSSCLYGRYRYLSASVKSTDVTWQVIVNLRPCVAVSLISDTVVDTVKEKGLQS